MGTDKAPGGFATTHTGESASPGTREGRAAPHQAQAWVGRARAAVSGERPNRMPAGAVA